jgi:adenosine/AMP kinase
MTATLPPTRLGDRNRFWVRFCLTRVEGNDNTLKGAAHASVVGAGFTVYISLRDGYPINVVSRIREITEVCDIL